MSVQITDGTTVPTFADLGLPQAVVDVLAGNGIDTPFPIQAATLPDSLAGRDVLGRGRTGSGKTYAFLLPMVTQTHSEPDEASTGPSARAHPRPDPRAGRPDRRRARTVGRRDELAVRRRIRRRRAPAADRQAARRRRHRHRLPRPPGRPREIAPCGSVGYRDHRARRGRPYGGPRLPTSGEATDGQDASQRTTNVVLRHAWMVVWMFWSSGT